MPSVSLSFKVHIPYRLKRFTPGMTGINNSWFDEKACKNTVDRLSDESYLPANKIIHELIKEQKGSFKIAFSFSGTSLELLQKHRPDVLTSFKQLVNTGCVEIFSETYYHSLSWLHSKNEFKRQVQQHDGLIRLLFGTGPAVFRNTELIYNNELAKFIAEMGYKGILCEGLEKILNGRTPNHTYASPGNGDFGLLLRNVRLSDDIAFRFDDPCWNEQPLTAEKYAGWLLSQRENICNVNLFFDYETFGIHKKVDSGIFQFLEHLPSAVLSNTAWKFVTPSEALDNCYPKDIYDVPETISWDNTEMFSCVGSENMMQNNTLRKIYSLENMVTDSGMPGALEWWGSLQSGDHFYYMSNDGRTANDTYRLLNPFNSSEEAFENYKNAVADFEIKLIQKALDDIKNINSLKRFSSIFSTMIY
ncbi:MAG TPA: glycoside hydrolase family 57 protein [Chitinophagaceae bacterium]|nr:glycoside hydrolase family 57 protein [Chitinophagaceae bacterium]